MIVVRNRFYFIFALTVTLLTTVGFFRTFYARPLFDLPPLPSMLMLHGIAGTAWLVLFVIQTHLIAARRVKVHMTLGMSGAVLALVFVVTGVATALQAAVANLPRPMGLTSQQFFIVPLSSIGLYAICFAAALALRRNTAFHKRLMVLAMISVLGPAIFRVIRLLHGTDYFLIAQTAIPAVLILWCLINDWRKHHLVHPVYAIGGSLIVLSWPLRMAVAHSDTWTNIAGWVVRNVSM